MTHDEAVSVFNYIRYWADGWKRLDDAIKEHKRAIDASGSYAAEVKANMTLWKERHETLQGLNRAV